MTPLSERLIFIISLYSNVLRGGIWCEKLDLNVWNDSHCFLILCPSGVYSSKKIADVFAYESSELDWCEDNYKHSEHVVEYFNTVSCTETLASFRKHCYIQPLLFHWLYSFIFFLQMSSFFFFIISPIMLYLLHPYAKERSLSTHMVWIMMIFVGKSIFVPVVPV